MFDLEKILTRQVRKYIEMAFAVCLVLGTLSLLHTGKTNGKTEETVKTAENTAEYNVYFVVENGVNLMMAKYDIDLYVDVDFVDLDLPSGLLWSSIYRMGEEDKPLYLTYEEASTMDIPTEEQFNELVENCNWSHIMGYVGRGGYDIRQPVGKYCNSVNGERISFYDEGMKYIGSGYVPQGIRFWIRDDVDEAEKK